MIRRRYRRLRSSPAHPQPHQEQAQSIADKLAVNTPPHLLHDLSHQRGERILPFREDHRPILPHHFVDYPAELGRAEAFQFQNFRCLLHAGRLSLPHDPQEVWGGLLRHPAIIDRVDQLHEHFFTDLLFLYPLPAEPDRHLDEEGSDYRRCQMSTLGQRLEGGSKLRVVNLEGEFRTEGVLLLVFLDLLTPRDWYLFEEALLPPRCD